MDGITDSLDVSLSELRELVMDREAWRAVIHGVVLAGGRKRCWGNRVTLCRLACSDQLDAAVVTHRALTKRRAPGWVLILMTTP